MQVGGRVVVATLVVVLYLTVHAPQGVADRRDGAVGLPSARGLDLVVLGREEAVAHVRGDAVLQELGRASVRLTLLLGFLRGRGDGDALAVLLLLLLPVVRYDLPGGAPEWRSAVRLRFEPATWNIRLG